MLLEEAALGGDRWSRSVLRVAALTVIVAKRQDPAHERTDLAGCAAADAGAERFRLRRSDQWG
jgi:hypothetical protein